MKSLLAVALCVSLLAPGCAVSSSSLSSPSGASRLSLVEPARQGGDIPRSYAEQLPVGKEVEVRLKDGERFKATYMGVEGDAIRVQPLTRIPVPSRLIPLGDVAQLRLSQGSGVGSVAKGIIIGAATGAAVFFGLLLVAIAANAS